MTISRTRLRAVLNYNPSTGRFTWLVDGRGRFMRKGATAGTINGQGYRQICVDGVIYLAARLAFLWMTGRMPRRLAEHMNRKKSDDRWRNLRPASYSQNGANTVSRNALGLKGVIYIPPKGTQRSARPYHARIKVNYRFMHLGSFATARAASAAYIAAARKHFGDFARAR